MKQAVLESESSELVEPHAVVVDERCIWSHDTDAQTLFRRLSRDRETRRAGADDQHVHIVAAIHRSEVFLDRFLIIENLALLKREL